MSSPSAAQVQPEQYFVKPTEYCPNSSLPVLVYRDVLPQPLDEQNASDWMQRNGWDKRGCWGTIKTKHFHPNTHECYGTFTFNIPHAADYHLTTAHTLGIFQGSSLLVLGEGGADESHGGVRVKVSAGDVIVIPAGVAHATDTADSSALDETVGAYRYIGVYPNASPRWRSEFGKRRLKERDDLIVEAGSVPVPPSDPLYGEDGPLLHIWRAAKTGTVL